VVAVLVEVVDVQARRGSVEVRPHLTGEDLVPKPLCGNDFLAVSGDEERVAARGGPNTGGSADEKLCLRHASRCTRRTATSTCLFR
jgi:hypothetical protein